MFKRFLFTFLIIIPFVASSQSNITVSKPYAVIDAKKKFYFSKGDEILAVKVDDEERRVSIQKFNVKTLELISTKEYNDLPEESFLEDVIEVNNKYYLFYSNWNSSEKAEQLLAKEIDFTKGDFLDKGKPILKVSNKLARDEEKFHFFFSRDSAKILIQYRLKPRNSDYTKNHDIIGFAVFDESIKLLWEKQEEMQYTEKKMNNLDYSIDSQGHVVMLAGVFNDNTTKLRTKDGNANYHLELLRIYPDSPMGVSKVELGDKFISRIWFRENASGNIICVGYYNTRKDIKDVDGVVLFKINPDGKMSDVQYYEIPLEILNQYVGLVEQHSNEKKEEEDKAEFKDLELRNLVTEEDGSVLLIGEQYYSVTKAGATMGGGYATTYYHYNDILITKIDKDGKLVWMKKLPKRQNGRNKNGGTLSFKYLKGENCSYFIFLDNEKNLNLPINKVPEEHVNNMGGFLTAYKVTDGNGDVSKISILDTRNLNGMEVFQFTPNRILPISKRAFVLEEYKKDKEDVLIKVIFAE